MSHVSMLLMRQHPHVRSAVFQGVVCEAYLYFLRTAAPLAPNTAAPSLISCAARSAALGSVPEHSTFAYDCRLLISCVIAKQC